MSRRSYIDKLAFLELRDGKLLMTLTKGKHTWYNAGGKREGTETDTETLVREVQEELGVTLHPESLTYYGTFEAPAHDQPADTYVRLTCYTGQYDGTPTAQGEIERVAFLSYRDRHQTSVASQHIFADLKTKGLLH